MSRRKRPAPTAEPGLTFQWTLRESSIGRLVFYGTATLLALAAFFFVFRVVYPESDAEPLVSRRIIRLSSADPAAQPLIRRAIDHSFALLPASEPDDATAPLPGFEPSFSGYRIRLKPITPQTTSTQTLRLFTPGRSVLPPLGQPPRPARPDAPSTPPRLALRLSGPAAQRLPQPVSWTDIPLKESVKTRFHLGIKDDGRVLFALPMEPIENIEIQDQLLRRISALAFAPASQPGVTWTQATFEWEKPGTP